MRFGVIFYATNIAIMFCALELLLFYFKSTSQTPITLIIFILMEFYLLIDIFQQSNSKSFKPYILKSHIIK